MDAFDPVETYRLLGLLTRTAAGQHGDLDQLAHRLVAHLEDEHLGVTEGPYLGDHRIACATALAALLRAEQAHDLLILGLGNAHAALAGLSRSP